MPGVLPQASSQSQVAWPAYFSSFCDQILSFFAVYLDISGGWIAGGFKEGAGREQREVVGNVNDDGLFLNRFGQLPPDWAVGTSCKL